LAYIAIGFAVLDFANARVRSAPLFLLIRFTRCRVEPVNFHSSIRLDTGFHPILLLSPSPSPFRFLTPYLHIAPFSIRDNLVPCGTT
jgi:hypothetical protein